MRYTTFLILTCLFVGCSESWHESERHNSAVPEILTVRELEMKYTDVIDRDVMLEGKLIVENGHYSIVAWPNNEVADDSSEFKISLSFKSAEINDTRMEHCLSGPTLVTGHLGRSMEITVWYVKLAADVLKPDTCYYHFE